MDDRLKACPWCNGPAETRNNRWNGRDHWGVTCTGCGDPWFECCADTEAEAIAAWNMCVLFTTPVELKDEGLRVWRDAWEQYQDSGPDHAASIITAALAPYAERVKVLEGALQQCIRFIEMMADNDLDEQIADNGMTVGGKLQYDAPALILKARAALENTNDKV